jgi:hypothetical protein
MRDFMHETTMDVVAGFFVAGIKSGKDISEATGIPRSTVYDYVHYLKRVDGDPSLARKLINIRERSHATTMETVADFFNAGIQSAKAISLSTGIPRSTIYNYICLLNKANGDPVAARGMRNIDQNNRRETRQEVQIQGAAA